MSVSYTTITSKGQITLPAEVRRALGLKPGQKVAVRVEDECVVIDAPGDIARVRNDLRQEAQRRGTWRLEPTSGDGWVAQAEARNAES
ncbi:MAG: AbrB/MazE/SpoVT family DNA-binding domain-containing protein [Microbacterium sp.]